MNRKKIVSLVMAACLVVGSSMPAFASIQNNPDVYPFPGGKTFADKSYDNDLFTIQYEGGNATNISLKDYLVNENIDPNSISITGGEWKDNVTDENCNPTTAKEWKLSYSGYYTEIVDDKEVKVPTEETITLLDYETPKTVEKYEVKYGDEQHRVLTSKINRMLAETKEYDGVTTAKYTVNYKVENNVQYVTVYENGKGFWRQAPNKNLSGLEIFEKDLVLTAAITSDFNEDKIENFVQSIYRLALDRTPDQSGFLYWTESLKSQDVSGRYILENLLNEAEYRSMNITDEDFVKDMYAIIVDRQADEQGFNYWVNRYNTLVEEIAQNLIDVPEGQKYSVAQGEARVQILRHMMNESEFKLRCEAMGIKF